MEPGPVGSGRGVQWDVCRSDRLRPAVGHGLDLAGVRHRIAIGAGTDVAIESAGVVLASSDPRGVVSVIRLSQASYRKMVQNLAWAVGYNVVAIPLAAGAFAWAGITLAPAVGAILMSLSTIIVALNAQLLRRLDLRPDASRPAEVRAGLSTRKNPSRSSSSSSTEPSSPRSRSR